MDELALICMLLLMIFFGIILFGLFCYIYVEEYQEVPNNKKINKGEDNDDFKCFFR